MLSSLAPTNDFEKSAKKLTLRIEIHLFIRIFGLVPHFSCPTFFKFPDEWENFGLKITFSKPTITVEVQGSEEFGESSNTSAIL